MTQPYALVIGESLVDLIEGAGPDGDVVYRPRLGGSPLNVAVGCRRLGAATRFATALGRDVFAARLRAYLREEGVAVAGGDRSTSGTVLAVAVTDRGHVRYDFFGDRRSLSDIPSVDRDVAAEAAVVHAGSAAFNADPAYGTALAAYRGATGFRTMDPNSRPSLVDDPDAYRARVSAAMAAVDLVKLSADDAAYLYPGTSIADAARQVRGDGTATVIVTQAADPTLLLHGDDLLSIPVPAIEPVDPTGAGDSFMASVIAAVVEGGAPPSAEAWVRVVRDANAAAAITCSSVGGAAAMPTRDQVAVGAAR